MPFLSDDQLKSPFVDFQLLIGSPPRPGTKTILNIDQHKLSIAMVGSLLHIGCDLGILRRVKLLDALFHIFISFLCLCLVTSGRRGVHNC
jgi:hypothetical protein